MTTRYIIAIAYIIRNPFSVWSVGGWHAAMWLAQSPTLRSWLDGPTKTVLEYAEYFSEAATLERDEMLSREEYERELDASHMATFE